jgi:hypothetical protein
MRTLYFSAAAIVVLVCASAMADPVPLPCDPAKCPPIDPCKINPDRCKDKGGPIEKDTKKQNPEASSGLPRALYAQASCTRNGLASQCAQGCSAADSCRSNAISYFAAQCQSGAIDPATAAQRVSLSCDSCIKQNCR